MGNDLTKKVDFNQIRYANCWEDADILCEGLKPLGENKRFLSIASAGDNSFALLTLNPECVYAVDVNHTQLYLVELKKCCIQHFEHEKTLAFLGFLPAENRIEMYKTLRPFLSQEAVAFWDKQLTLLAKGVIYSGKFERYFRFFAKRILPLIHTKKRIHELFRPKSDKEQEEFYTKKWNNRRWKFFFKLFFSKYIMGKYGRDPEFLKQVNLKVSDYIYQKAATHLKQQRAQHNWILYYTLNGSFGNHLPFYLHPNNYATIRANIHKLHLIQGYAHDAIAKHGVFDGMNLSNIFEYMDKTTFETVGHSLLKGLAPNGRFCYWNLMVPRTLSGLLAHAVAHEKNQSEKLSAIDKGFFYNRFIVDCKQC